MYRHVNIDTYSGFVLLLIVHEIQICAKTKQTIFEMYVASSRQTDIQNYKNKCHIYTKACREPPLNELLPNVQMRLEC